MVVKGENAYNQLFLIFPQCFLPFSNQISNFQSHIFRRLQMLTLYHKIPIFNNPWIKAFENIAEKWENAGNQHLLLFPQFFLTLLETKFLFFSKIYFVVWKSFEFGLVKYFVVRYRVNPLPYDKLFQAISPFLTMFSTLYGTYFSF